MYLSKDTLGSLYFDPLLTLTDKVGRIVRTSVGSPFKSNEGGNLVGSVER